MRQQSECFSTRLSVLAVRGALIAIALASGARAAEKEAEDPAVAELTRPTNRVEFGLVNVNESSAKFGEYNGLGQSGLYGDVNFDLHGGGAYDSNDATRWNLRGSNLGLEIRELSGDYGVQGKFRLNFGYGELLHRLSDSYQTPYRGAGSSTLTLPSNWLKPCVPAASTANLNFRGLSAATAPAGSGNCTQSTGATPAVQTVRNNDLPAFYEFDLKTKRKTADGGFGYDFSPQWGVTGSVRRETKEGAKPIGAISTKSGTESTLILPDPVDTTTDQFNLGLNYTGEKGFLQAAYYGVMFRNNVNSLSWQDPSNLGVFSTMSSAPSNQFHQLNLTGGYSFSPVTKLVMNGSYGRNTQDDAFLTDPQLPVGLPRSSLDGLVVTKGFNLKLTSRPTKGLNLATGYKFDDRDNRTPVNTYVFYDINVPPAATPSAFNSALGLPAGTGNNINIYNNRPFSKRVNQFDLDGDYALTRSHTLAGGYQFQKIDRHCSGTWIDCVDADTTKENTLHAEWRARLTDEVSSKVGYAFSRRTVDDYNTNGFLALVPMANAVPSTAAAAGVSISAYQYLLQNALTSFGPFAGYVPGAAQSASARFYTLNNNIAVAPTFYSLYGSRNNVGELPGMQRFNVADRDRDKFRSSINWEASERLSLYGGLDFNQDDFRNSPLGLQNAKSWMLNLDGAYSISDALSFSLFYTYEDQRSTQDSFIANASNLAPPANAAGVLQPNSVVPGGGCSQDLATLNSRKKIDPCNAWSSESRDRVDTIGLSVRYKSFMGGKLDVIGSVLYTRAHTDIGVRGGAYVANPSLANPGGTATPQIFIPATDLPTVNSNSLELRLNGQYALDKSSALRLLYAFKRLNTSDFAYDAAQFGTLTSLMPSNEQSPNYSVHVIGVSYIHRFQ